MIPQKLLAGVASALTVSVCAFGLSSFSPFRQVPPSETDPTRGQTNTSVGPQVETPIAMLGEAASFIGTFGAAEDFQVETAIHIYNDSPGPRTFRVEWLYDAGGPNSVAGVTGPITINPGESRTIGSDPASGGSADAPYPLDSGWAQRDTTADFTGRAIVYSDPDGYRGVAINAFRVSGVRQDDSSMSNEIQSIPVFRIKPEGVARQAGD